MKLYDFGLWFVRHFGCPLIERWSTTIPKEICGFAIFYDGGCLGYYWDDFSIMLYDREPHIIKMKPEFDQETPSDIFIGRHLMIDDFEIIPNPDYKGNE